eukprot:SAG22_NODE_265_length_13348_cov_150.719149_18_plen_166_part_00
MRSVQAGMRSFSLQGQTEQAGKQTTRKGTVLNPIRVQARGKTVPYCSPGVVDVGPDVVLVGRLERDGLLGQPLDRPTARLAGGRVPLRQQLIATSVRCERSGTARKGRETEGKAVITAFKSMPVASPGRSAAAATARPARPRARRPPCRPGAAGNKCSAVAVSKH